MIRSVAMPESEHFRFGSRRSVNLAASLCVEDGTWHSVQVVDLGLGGAGLTSKFQVAPGTFVQLEWAAAELWDPLSIEARVAWCAGRDELGRVRLGLSFEHQSAGRLRVLMDFLAATVPV